MQLASKRKRLLLVKLLNQESVRAVAARVARFKAKTAFAREAANRATSSRAAADQTASVRVAEPALGAGQLQVTARAARFQGEKRLLLVQLPDHSCDCFSCSCYSCS